jgi:hypothetical protein
MTTDRDWTASGIREILTLFSTRRFATGIAGGFQGRELGSTGQRYIGCLVGNILLMDQARVIIRRTWRGRLPGKATIILIGAVEGTGYGSDAWAKPIQRTVPG